MNCSRSRKTSVLLWMALILANPATLKSKLDEPLGFVPKSPASSLKLEMVVGGSSDSVSAEFRPTFGTKPNPRAYIPIA